MTFKSKWETTHSQHALSPELITKMVQLAYPDKALLSQSPIDSGCANLNIKIQVQDNELPLILRVYLRDPAAAKLEKRLGLELKNSLPVPLCYFIGEVDGYHFAIMQFMPGQLLRDLILADEFVEMDELMYSVGQTLANISVHEFPEGLTPPPKELASFGQECLQDEVIKSQLSPELIEKIAVCLDRFQPLFPSQDDNHLVHGDFDPSNILVDKVKGKWKVTGILDWEFAFSGSMLCDVANVMRYAKQLPEEYEDGFLNGLESNGLQLPDCWGISAHLYTLTALLDCLKRSNPQTQPNRCEDIRNLIEPIIDDLYPLLD